MVILDTNVIIYYLQGELSAVRKIQKLREAGEIFAVSIITKIELLSYPLIASEETEKINSLLKECYIVYLNEMVAEKAVELRKKYKILLADVIIAASGIAINAPLLTRNIKHFKKIKEIKFVLD